MELTNQEILEAIKCFDELKKLRLKTILKFKIAKNLKVLIPKKEILDETRDGSDIPGAIEYQKKKKELVFSFSEDGKTIPPEHIETLESEFKKLQEEYKETLEEIQKRETEFRDILKKEEKVSIFLLDLKDFPEEVEIDIGPLLPFLGEEEE